MGWSTQQSAARIIEELADEYGGIRGRGAIMSAISEYEAGTCMDCGGPCLILVRVATATGVRTVTPRPAMAKCADGVRRTDWRGICKECAAQVTVEERGEGSGA